MITIILALVVAFMWGAGEIFDKKATNHYNAINVLVHSYIFEIISFLLFTLVTDINAFTRFNLEIFKYIAPLFVFSICLGNVFYLCAIKYGNLSIVSPILASDPIYVILIGIFLFHEDVSIDKLIPLIIIVASICALNFIGSKTKEKVKKTAIIFASAYAFVTAIVTTLEKSTYLSGFKIADFYFHYSLLLILLVIILLIYMKIKHIKFEKPNKDIFISNSLNRVGYFVHSYLLSTSYVSIITPITGLYSVVTHILAIKILKEKLSLKQSICVFLIIISTIVLLLIHE